MNDRYLFRGKRADNGEWVRGRLLSDDVIVPCGEEFEICGGYIECKNVKGFEVIPETVGQCVGLKDKNGKLIFESDIVNYEEVLEKRAETLHGTYCTVYDYCYYSPFDCITPSHCEVIGNIHDNPELSEVKNE